MRQVTKEIEFKKRTRRLTLRVLSADRIKITAPHNLPIELIEKFILSKSQWIEKKLKAHEDFRNPEFFHGGKIPYLGVDLIIQVESGCSEAIREGHLLKLYFKNGAVDSDQIKMSVIHWYIRQAQKLCTAYANHYSARLKTNYSSIQIKNYNSRWGACTIEKKLIFNWQVVMLEPELFKYIVAHEVCHLLEMNHGPKFYRHVRQLGFDKNKIHKQMRENGRKILI